MITGVEDRRKNEIKRFLLELGATETNAKIIHDHIPDLTITEQANPSPKLINSVINNIPVVDHSWVDYCEE